MESLLESAKKTQENKFEIIGNEHQVLQLVLYPGESIDTYANGLIYMSPNIKKKNKALGMKESLMHFFMNQQGEAEFYNDSETIGYIGISKRIGKVLVINANDSCDIYFRGENLLAHTSGMTIDKKQKFLELGFVTWNKFKSNANKGLQLFLQSSHGLIEKELGANEEVIINKSAVFAFSSKVKFSFQKPQTRGEISTFVKAKGPGLLYIENRHIQANVQMQNYAKAVIPVLMLLFYIMISVVLWHLEGM